MSTATRAKHGGTGLDAAGNRRPYRAIRADQHAEVREELREQFGDNERIDPSEDTVAWRRAIRTNALIGPVYRILVAALGLILIVVGIPMVPLVGPGWAVIFVGLYVWSTEFMWARRVTQFVKAEVKTFHAWTVALPWSAKIPLGMLSIVFGWACLYAAFMLTGVPDWFPDVVQGRLEGLPGLD